MVGLMGLVRVSQMLRRAVRAESGMVTRRAQYAEFAGFIFPHSLGASLLALRLAIRRDRTPNNMYRSDMFCWNMGSFGLVLKFMTTSRAFAIRSVFTQASALANFQRHLVAFMKCFLFKHRYNFIYKAFKKCKLSKREILSTKYEWVSQSNLQLKPAHVQKANQNDIAPRARISIVRSKKSSTRSTTQPRTRLKWKKHRRELTLNLSSMNIDQERRNGLKHF